MNCTSLQVLSKNGWQECLRERFCVRIPCTSMNCTSLHAPVRAIACKESMPPFEHCLSLFAKTIRALSWESVLLANAVEAPSWQA